MLEKTELKLEKLNPGNEPIGKRVSRIRREKGYTQTELADKIGINQTHISDYERGKVRLHAEIIIRFAQALNISIDELLGMDKTKGKSHRPNLNLHRRLKKIEALPKSQQQILIKTIDTFIKAAES